MLLKQMDITNGFHAELKTEQYVGMKTPANARTLKNGRWEMNSERERLINSFSRLQLTTTELRSEDVPYIPNWNYELLADLILADRQRILAPLVEYKLICGDEWGKLKIDDAVDAALRLAGLTGKE
jgi:hypothetical protein